MNAAITLTGRPEARLTIEKGSIHRTGDTGGAVSVLTIASKDGHPSTASIALSTMGYLTTGREFLGLAWN